MSTKKSITFLSAMREWAAESERDWFYRNLLFVSGNVKVEIKKIVRDSLCNPQMKW